MKLRLFLIHPASFHNGATVREFHPTSPEESEAINNQKNTRPKLKAHANSLFRVKGKLSRGKARCQKKRSAVSRQRSAISRQLFEFRSRFESAVGN